MPVSDPGMADGGNEAAEQQGESTPESPENVVPFVRQPNKHDVKALEGQANAMLARIGALGAQVDIGGIQRDATINALGRLLVAKGILTQGEIQAEGLAIVCQTLGAVLQQVEDAALAAKRPRLAVPGGGPGGLVVARH